MPKKSRKKSRSGQKKKTKEPELFLTPEEELMDKIVRESISKLDPKNYEGVAAYDEIQQKRISSGLDQLTLGDSEKKPNIPSCDACDLDFSGTLRCSECECAFYCSKECQKKAWKHLGHKQECKTMKENAQNTARLVVDLLNDQELPPLRRVTDLNYKLNDNGSYMFAVEYGLHEAIRQAFIDDCDVLKNHQLQNEIFNIPHNIYDVSLTRTIMTCLFRGERISKKNQSFRKIDASRIQGYLRAFPDDGLQVWWKGSWYMIDVVVCTEFESLKQFRYHQVMRDILAVWHITLGSKRVSELILLTHDKEKCKERAVWMLDTMQPYMVKLQEAGPDLDHNVSLDAYMNVLAAIIQIRCQQLAGIEIDAPRVLKLTGEYLAVHRRLHFPFAEAHLKKCNPDYEKIMRC